MNSPVLTLKAELRQRIRGELGQLASADRASLSAQLCNSLTQQAAWQSARAVLLFAPLADELNIVPLVTQALAQGKTAALPRFSTESGDYVAAQVREVARDLTPGRFGVLEPRPDCPVFPMNRLDLLLVPGVAFDLCGRRLGRGKGFYDRLLVQVTGSKCGVAYDFQIVPEVPAEPHDMRVNCLVTPTRWLAIAGRGAD